MFLVVQPVHLHQHIRATRALARAHDHARFHGSDIFSSISSEAATVGGSEERDNISPAVKRIYKFHYCLPQGGQI